MEKTFHKKELMDTWTVTVQDTDIIYCSNCGRDTLKEEEKKEKDLKQIVTLLENLDFTDEYIAHDDDGSFVAFTKDTNNKGVKCP